MRKLLLTFTLIFSFAAAETAHETAKQFFDLATGLNERNKIKNMTSVEFSNRFIKPIKKARESVSNACDNAFVSVQDYAMSLKDGLDATQSKELALYQLDECKQATNP